MEQQLHSGYLYLPNYTASHFRRLWSSLNKKVVVSLNRSGSDDADKTPHMPAETLLFHWWISRNTELLLLLWLISSTTCIIQPVFRGAECFLKIGCATERCANPVRVFFFFFLHFVDRASRYEFLLITNFTHFSMYIFISSLCMFRASQCSSSGGRIVLIHHLVWSVCVSDCLVCPSGPAYQAVTYTD